MLSGVIILSEKFKILVWEMLQTIIRINLVFYDTSMLVQVARKSSLGRYLSYGISQDLRSCV